MVRLSAEAQRAATQPADHALAIYVSPALTRSFRLPQSVEPRAVVERTFATRPLISALHRMPPHVVLVLHATCAHLYAAADGGLHPVNEVDPFRGHGRIRLPAPGDPDADEVRRDLNMSYLQAVDRMLGDYRAEHPSPLVLAGSPRLLDRFCAMSSNLERLAGRLATGEEGTALDLVMACTWAIDEYLKNRREEAIEQLAQALRARPGDVATGIDACWRTLASDPPQMLLVEDSFVSPGLAIEGSSREAARAGVSDVHDLVDDLIEQVILHGGQFALVRDGDLESHGRVALISRSHRSSWTRERSSTAAEPNPQVENLRRARSSPGAVGRPRRVQPHGHDRRAPQHHRNGAASTLSRRARPARPCTGEGVPTYVWGPSQPLTYEL
jgi:Bacterial archaeo-eukaryotic release factor family 3